MLAYRVVCRVQCMSIHQSRYRNNRRRVKKYFGLRSPQICWFLSKAYTPRKISWHFIHNFHNPANQQTEKEGKITRVTETCIWNRLYIGPAGLIFTATVGLIHFASVRKNHSPSLSSHLQSHTTVYHLRRHHFYHPSLLLSVTLVKNSSVPQILPRTSERDILRLEVCENDFLVRIPFPLPSNHSHSRQWLYNSLDYIP